MAWALRALMRDERSVGVSRTALSFVSAARVPLVVVHRVARSWHLRLVPEDRVESFRLLYRLQLSVPDRSGELSELVAHFSEHPLFVFESPVLLSLDLFHSLRELVSARAVHARALSLRRLGANNIVSKVVQSGLKRMKRDLNSGMGLLLVVVPLRIVLGLVAVRGLGLVLVLVLCVHGLLRVEGLLLVLVEGGLGKIGVGLHGLHGCLFDLGGQFLLLGFEGKGGVFFGALVGFLLGLSELLLEEDVLLLHLISDYRPN